ncbi:MAG TPA: GAF domain-containing protein [Ignavibacteriaceae bacterium]|jgi:diguanylate cyclase (GGDEF)-like protein|nr:GAF domain-containing protein [Ignavibacteriaceae bacterium]
MNRKQKRRIFIFSLFPVLISIHFLTDDLIIRIIAVILTAVYVGLLIFLRDSFKLEKKYDEKEEEPVDLTPPPSALDDPDESFKIISKSTNPDLITDENVFKVNRGHRVQMRPPDLKERFEEIVNEELPGEVSYDGQFAFVLEKVLITIKEAFHANTSIFFWYNKKSEKLSIERFVSNSTEITVRKFDLENDILSNIVKKAEPELLSDIPAAAEADVIRYYTAVQGIKSFVGVPLFYDKSLIGILAIDSKEEDSFGIETIFSLGRFVRLITILINLFEQKYIEFTSQKRLGSLLNFIQPADKYEEEKDLIESIEKSIQHLIHWDAFAFVFYNPFNKGFRTAKVINNTSLKFIGENLDVDLNGTLVGKCILTGTPVKIDDTSAAEYKRFSKVEDVSFDGSFLAIPLIYQSQNYGVLCFESLKKNDYNKSDVDFLRKATNFLSFTIYSYSNQRLLKSLISLDIETRVLNAENFKERLHAELVKSKVLKIPGAIAVIRLDDFLEQESLFDTNPFYTVLNTVADIVTDEVGTVNLVGRLGEKLFGVYFFNSNSKDVYIWAEKLRVRIARQTISVMSKQTTFTVSIGVAASNGKDNPDELLHNASLALQKAIEGGGNKVRNIN